MRSGKIGTRATRSVVAGLAGFIVLACWPGYAEAQSARRFHSELQSFGELLIPADSHLTLGAGPSYEPDYVGSDDYEVNADLIIHFQYGKRITLNNDGADINLLGHDVIYLGPIIRVAGGRSEDANPALAGLGKVGTSLELGAFIKLLIDDRYVIRFRYRHGVTGHDAGLMDLTLGARLYRNEAKTFSVAASARGEWFSKKYANTFFGISADQAASSGLAEYALGSVVGEVGAGLTARWAFARKWSLNGYVEYSRLLGSVADSPIVSDFGAADQVTVGIYIARIFDFD